MLLTIFLLFIGVTYVNQGNHQVVNKNSSRVMVTDQHIVLTNGDGETASYIVPGHQRDYEYIIDSSQRSGNFFNFVKLIVQI